MLQERNALVKQILALSDQIFNTLIPELPQQWLSADVTLVQLRLLFVLNSTGPKRMSDLASAMDAVMSTTTGIVDNLVKKEMVAREADPQDRRVVVCRLTKKGEELAGGLWRWGQSQVEGMLQTLTLDQLKLAVGSTQFLMDNILKQNLAD
ncbi:MAG: MarR family transcriptional regulator [Chloroflexi bacterium]|jgi:DNA-binding MarR family transcriptional regulator|nr:MarR family transcriptional regulator [Chloroflexota bacterium]MBT7081053.1 MarR family transcriptional regulator [Chloroflexota bacterium]MBT7289784.1 MarR family transcriptional regulator [Chloroflexota bacterium]